MVALLLRQRLLACSAFVSLQQVTELSGIGISDGELRLGALTT